MNRRSFVGAIASLLTLGCCKIPNPNLVFINKPSSKSGKWIETINIVLTEKSNVIQRDLMGQKIVFELHKHKKGAIVLFNDSCEFVDLWPGEHRVISNSSFWEKDLKYTFFKISCEKLSNIYSPF